MAQSPPTFVSSKNSPHASPAHLHRQIELQSNAQTPFLECFLGLETVPNGVIVFDQVVKDTFGRYNPHTGVYVFPVNGFWIATMWGGNPVALNFYSVPLNPSNPAATILPFSPFGQSNTAMTTWQFWAGPNVSAVGGTPGFASGPGPGAMSVFSGGGGDGGPYLCQLDLTCIAQY